MKVSVSKVLLEKLKSGLVVVPILEGEKPLPFQKKDMKGEFKKLYLSYEGHKGCERVLFAGLGKKKEVDAERVRRVFSLAVKKVKSLKIEEFSVFLGRIPGVSDQDAANAVVEGALLGNYSFDKYKTKEKGEKEIKQVALLAKGNVRVDDTVKVCENVNFVRDMVNENADVMTPDRIVSVAREISRKNRMKFKALGSKELRRLGMNLLLAVGQGGQYQQSMAVLEYRGGGKEKFALVGKGITFDSGGLNLKPTNYIETMKQDMAGAAVVLGVMKTIAELKLKVNVVGVVPTCENAIGPKAYKPGDVLKSYSGKTVEVENTDAEGRLILADALAYAEKSFKPTQIIDIASLTGAALVIFGEFVTPVIGKGKFMKKLFEAGEKSHDRVWELPLYEDFVEEVKGEIADVRNLGYNKRYAGTVMGAAFLNKFVETPLIHLDIGGTTWHEKERFYTPKNATGAGVRLLVEFFRSVSK